MRSNAPRLQPRASAFVIRAEGGSHDPDVDGTVLLACVALAACNDQATAARQPAADQGPSARSRSSFTSSTHSISRSALKRAIYDAGYTCKRITDAGFVGTWQNLDEWMAHCEYDNGASRDWAIFAGPDGSAQVRDCKDMPARACQPA